MLSFQVEPWSRLWSEGEELFHLHYDELALHKDVMPMGLDNAFYSDLQIRNFLLVVTARRDGRLIGYYMAILIAHHPHNKGGGKVSTTDFFYIAPTERKGGAGAKLLRFVEGELRKHGVVKATISTKLKFSNRDLMEQLGWEPTDLVFQKIL